MDDALNQYLNNKSMMIKLETDNLALCDSLENTLLQYIENDTIKSFTKDVLNYHFLLGFRSACIYFNENLKENMGLFDLKDLIDEITNKAAIEKDGPVDL